MSCLSHLKVLGDENPSKLSSMGSRGTYLVDAPGPLEAVMHRKRRDCS